MPRNNADFHGIKLTHELEGDGYTTVTASLNGEKVGHMVLDHRGTVDDIQVDDNHQRKGIATSMWRHAQDLHKKGVIPHPPAHSSGTTEKGYRWAMTTGDPVPPRSPEMFWDMSESDDPQWKGKD